MHSFLNINLNLHTLWQIPLPFYATGLCLYQNVLIYCPETP